MPYQGEIAALTAVFLWGSTALLFESAGKRIGATNTNLLRLVLATIFLCLTLFLQTGYFYPIHASKEQHIWLGLSGIIGLAIGDAALFISLVIIGSRLAVLLLSLAPVFATILAWIFLGERLSYLAIFGITLTIAGIFWVVYERQTEEIHGSKTKGVILGIIAALGQGIGVILAKYGFRTEIGTLEATLIRMVPATIFMWLVVLFVRKLPPVGAIIRDKKSARFILIASIIGPYLGVWLANAAVKYTEAGVAATLLATVPIFIIPMIWITRGSKPSLRATVGTFIAVAGVALIFLR
ncbi:DMT family transporter [candidate division KSB1 bacterium]|nr:DMT family transporter [candidate division KSB1 bacterium]